MKYITAVLGLLMTALTLPAYANVTLYDRPAFMAESMPERIPCEYNNRAALWECVGDVVLLPSQIAVKVIDNGNVRVEFVNTIVKAACHMGVCFNTATRASVGDAQPTMAAGAYATTQWHLYEGYYLTADTDGKVYAFKNGYGPKGSSYPPYRIHTEAADKPLAKAKGTFDVYCSPRSDTCTFGADNREVEREDLPKLMPVGGSDNCIDEFCYNDYQEIIGLNPDYGLFH